VSYCRFGEADVYVYLDCGGYLCCCGCILPDEVDRQWQHHSTADMVAHLRKHQQADHDVPESVIAELEARREENDKWIADFENGAVS
jgi:hypothetical protein